MGRRGRGYQRAASSPVSSSRPSSSRRRPPGEPSEQDILRSIQQSPLRVRISLQLQSTQEVPALSDVLRDFEVKLDARRSSAVTSDSGVCVELLECGLSRWQQLVVLQRSLGDVKRQQTLRSRTLLRHDPKYDEFSLGLSFNRTSEDNLWTFASSLMLGLKSAGVFARVLLGNRVMLPLVSGFVEGNVDREQLQFPWEGESEWAQLVVHEASEDHKEMQRVYLPVVEPASGDLLTRLHYPELVPLVDGMLNSNSDPSKPIAVILRGIPGSGKSTLGREIAEICRHHGVTFTVCSADFTFETPRGYVFDVKKLGSAHNNCRREFTRAIEGQIPRNVEHGDSKHRGPRQHIVLVDNTSTQLWEYEPYEEVANSRGCRVYILEMRCPDILTAFRMGKRNSHGVPPDKVVSMYLRWEEDPRAQCFTPQFAHAMLTANPLSDGDVGGLTYIGLVLDDDSQKRLLEQVSLVHYNKAADHVTLCYRPSTQYTRDAELGARFSVRGVQVVEDAKGQALRVELDELLPLQVRNKIPHVTLSTKDGVSAAYSNDLLESTRSVRTLIDPALELTAELGAALFVQNQRVIITSSPFTMDIHGSSDDYMAETKKTNLFVLKLEEDDLTEGSKKKDRPGTDSKLFLLREQILHHMGSACKTRRLLCIQRSQTSDPFVSSAALLDKLQSDLLLSPVHQFDDVEVLPALDPFQGFDEAIGKYQSGGKFSHITMLTTSQDPAQWPLRWIKCLPSALVNVVHVDIHGDAGRPNEPLSSQCTSVSSLLDVLGVNIQEQTRSAIVSGMDVVGDAWACVRGTSTAAARKEVRRIDTTLLGMASDVIELCILVPNDASDTLDALQEKMVSTLRLKGVIHRLEVSCNPGQFYFSVCLASSYSPVFCVRMIPDGKTDSAVVAQFKCCEALQKASRESCEKEVYSVLASLLRAILERQCSRTLPSECRLSSLVNLVSEQLVLHYIRTIDSLGERVSADDVVSGRIIHIFYAMLAQLSMLAGEEWPTALGDALLALQGNKRAQATWMQALENALNACKTMLDSNHCGGMRSNRASSLNTTHHLGVLVSLMGRHDGDADGLSTAAPVRAYIELPSRCQWSLLQTHTLCDRLRAAAKVLAPQCNDTCKADDGSIFFFSCAPNRVSRRVNMTGSSLEAIDIVVKNIPVLHDGRDHPEGWLPRGYAIRRAETDALMKQSD